MISPDRLRELLQDDPFVRELTFLEQVDSTNDELRRLARRGAPEGTVVIAASQLSGRGRHGRVWHSPRDAGLYVSVLFRPRRPATELTRWTLAGALAAADACRDVAGVPVEIEWPNDLVLAGRKLGGVLTEARAGADVTPELICGIGLNLSGPTDETPASLRERATSLQEEVGPGRLESERLAAGLLGGLGRLNRLLDRGRWEEIAARWMLSAPRADGCPVRVAATGARTDGFGGHTRGIGDDGALLVEDNEGRIHAVRMADAVAYPEE